MCGWYCFPKNKFVPLTCARSSPKLAPHWCCLSQRLPWPFLLCAVVFNKRLKPSGSIGPSLVLCLIHCLSPTPSAFYFALQSWSSAGSPSSSWHWVTLSSSNDDVRPEEGHSDAEPYQRESNKYLCGLYVSEYLPYFCRWVPSLY